MPYKIRASHLLRRYRAISQEKLLARNRLAGPETDAVNATGEPIDPNPQPFPEEIKAAFAISMRAQRWQGMQARLGSWKNRVKLWNATNGMGIHMKRWQTEGRASFGCSLTRGQLGCYDSHVRLWQHIVTENIPVTLIMEDDANVRHTADTAKRLQGVFHEVRKLKLEWDVLYLGRQRSNDIQKYSAQLVRPRGCCGLFAYVITLEGAKLLLSKAKPYHIPVDVFVGNMSDRNVIKALALVPRLCYVVPVRSDTNGIL